MTGISRGELLSVLIAVGRRLGIAQARSFVSGPNEDFTRAIAETLQLAGELASVDHVVSRLVREAAYATLHGEEPAIDGTSRETATRELAP
jgi:hypothetical protein